MDREYVESSMITSIGYDTNTSTLEIEFKSTGAVWQYYDFPENLWYEFKAGSLGKFWNANIKDQYRENQVG
jgi:hypothetical protein